MNADQLDSLLREYRTAIATVVTIEARLVAAISSVKKDAEKVATVVSEDRPETPTPVKPEPKPKSKPKAKDAPPTAVPVSAVAPMQAAPEAPEDDAPESEEPPVEKAAPAAPEKAPAKAPEAAAPTAHQVGALLRKVMEVKGPEVATEFLKRYGARNVSAFTKEQLITVHAECTALVG